MILWETWWVWLCAAIVLGIVEIMIPGFIFLGFAIGALLVSMLLLNTGIGISLPLLLLVFAVLSLIAWLALRRIFGRPDGKGVKYFDKDINDH